MLRQGDFDAVKAAGGTRGIDAVFDKLTDSGKGIAAVSGPFDRRRERVGLPYIIFAVIAGVEDQAVPDLVGLHEAVADFKKLSGVGGVGVCDIFPIIGSAVAVIIVGRRQVHRVQVSLDFPRIRNPVIVAVAVFSAVSLPLCLQGGKPLKTGEGVSP